DPKFRAAVWSNALTKDILAADDPELCELVAKGLGTEQVLERTRRIAPGPIFGLGEHIPGDASERLVEAYRLHPNDLRALAPCGQGYVIGCTRTDSQSYDGGRRA